MITRRYALAMLTALMTVPGSAWAGLEGQPLPPLKLKDADGTTLNVASLRGRAVLLHLWATWCRPCVQELPELQSLVTQLQEVPEVRVLAISLDRELPPAVVVSAARRFGAEFPIWFPKPGTAARLGVSSLPTSLVVGPDGRVTHVVEGAQRWSHPEWVKGLTALGRSAGG